MVLAYTSPFPLSLANQRDSLAEQTPSSAADSQLASATVFRESDYSA